MTLEIKQASSFVRQRTKIKPKIALILGSGLGALAYEIEAEATLPYAEIPNFPPSTVEGHSGQLVVGRLEGIAAQAVALVD